MNVVTHPSNPRIETRVTARNWYGLVILTAIYACHSLDRAVVSVVIEPMKHELRLDDKSVGIIAGLGYGLAYGLAAIPVGALVDRVNRVRLLSFLVLSWGALTALSGVAQSFTMLLLARMGVGVAEAGGQPAALSILSDSFPERRRASALGIFYFGSAVGYALSFGGGGLVATHYGWRAAFLVAGLPALVLSAILFLTVREPLRTGELPERHGTAPSLKLALNYLVRQTVLRHTFMAMLLASFSVSVLLVWMVPLLMRDHGLTLAQAGLAAGVAMGVFQAFGAFISGFLADRLARHSRHRIVIVPAVALALTTPLAIGIANAPSGWWAVAGIMVYGILPSSWTAPGYTVLLDQVEGRMRGTMMGVMQIGTTLLGAALAPFVVGVVSDAIGGSRSLAYAVSLLSLGGLWSAAHFALAGRAMKRQAIS